MALLQVRDFPQELYETLAQTARAEHRSTAQQTVVLLAEALGKPDEAALRRRALLSRLQDFDVCLPDSVPSAADLIREDRDR